ncbi:MAG TPA: hypothetical protein VGY98_16720 [Verrucomicrobiae bacterium]|nr:hypothetical protein [Verrucomicrobiae bacterium]
MLSIVVVGLYCFLIGTVGAMTTYLFTNDLLTNDALRKKLMSEAATSQPDVLPFLVGAICGGLPFGILALRWVSCSFLGREQKTTEKA